VSVHYIAAFVDHSNNRSGINVHHWNSTKARMSSRLCLGQRSAFDVASASAGARPAGHAKLWPDLEGRQFAGSKRDALLELSDSLTLLEVELSARSSVPVCSFDAWSGGAEEGENSDKDRG